MPEEERLVEVYTLDMKPEAQPWSLDQVGMVYSFGWMYSPGLLRVPLCPGAVAELRPSNGGVVARVYSVPGEGCWEQRLSRLTQILGMDEDLSAFHRMAGGDPLAGCIPGVLPGWRLRTMSPWAAFMVAVAQQNTGFRQGWGMLYRLHLAASRRLRGPGWTYLETPTPSPRLALAARESGWGYRSRTLAALAAVAPQLGVELYEAEPEGCTGIVEALSGVRGVGSYTRNLAMLLACRSYQSLPLDRWLARLAAEAYGVEPRRAGEALASRFPGYQGLAALASTICCDAEPYPRAARRLRAGECVPGRREPSPLTLWKTTPPDS